MEFDLEVWIWPLYNTCLLFTHCQFKLMATPLKKFTSSHAEKSPSKRLFALKYCLLESRFYYTLALIYHEYAIYLKRSKSPRLTSIKRWICKIDLGIISLSEFLTRIYDGCSLRLLDAICFAGIMNSNLKSQK